MSDQRKRAANRPNPPRQDLWLDGLNVGIVLCHLDGKIFWRNRVARMYVSWADLPPGLWDDDEALLTEAVTDGIHWWRCAVNSEGTPVGWAVWFRQESPPGAAEVRALEKHGASRRDIDAYLAKLKGDKSLVAGDDALMSPRTLEAHLLRLYRRFQVHSFEGLQAAIRDELAGRRREPPA